MTKHKMTSRFPQEPDSKTQPHLITYDSGYEHSVEHWFEMRQLFTEANEQHGTARPVDGVSVNKVSVA